MRLNLSLLLFVEQGMDLESKKEKKRERVNMCV